MKSIFFGEYKRRVYDGDKGNIIVPAKLRREMLHQSNTSLIIIDNHPFLAYMDEFVIPDYRYIHVWPLIVWENIITQEKIVEQILRNPLSIITFLSYKLHHLKISPPQYLDDRGRIPLDSHLRSYAAIEDEAIVIGMYNRIEIWSPDNWERCLRGMKGITNLGEGYSKLI